MAVTRSIMFCFYPLYVQWNHGIALLSALCGKEGIETSLCLLRDLDEFGKRLSDYTGEYVGFSAVCAEDLTRSVPFMDMAKRAGKTVLLGGVWAGLDKPAPDCVDYVCRGDGETLPAFILEGDRSLFENKLVCADLDSLPIPEFDLFEGFPFERGFPALNGKRVLPYVSSRGCIHECAFCQIQHQPKGMRIRRKMGEDLSFLRDKYNPDVFFLGDAMLPYHDRGWRESWGDFRHPFVCYLRADIKPETLEWLIERGMVGCAFGVESGDETFRNERLKKGLSDEQVFATVDVLRRCGVEYVPFFITDLPGENFLMKTKTAKMAATIGGYPIIWQYESLKGDCDGC